MDRTLLAGLLLGVVAIYLISAVQGSDDPEDDPEYVEPDLVDQAQVIFQEVTENMGINDNTQQNNLAAFLAMIRVSEGTAGTNGYSTLVGGSQFFDYSDHPRILIDLPNLGIKSSAAGAYQILRRTWDGVAAKLHLPDFSPASQDAAAVELIRQRTALPDVLAGRFAAAVEKCRKEWASLPGAGYGQRENSLERLQTAYLNAGGTVA
jgi:muramidase (phage lysozyme)